VTRHFVIPDRQAKPGIPLDHNTWLGKAIAKYRPDVLVDLGDNADFPSVSTHSAPGSLEKEGARLARDIEAAREADRLLFAAMGKFRPKRMVRLRGNHEDRLDRYLQLNPVLEGLLGLELLGDHDWEIVPYSNGTPGVIVIDGIHYAHYFANVNTGRPIGGTATYKLAAIGSPFVMGHVQGYDIGTRQYATGRVIRGIVAGSCYLHDEPYKGAANAHDRCAVVLNEVRNGRFSEMPLTLDYLCREYAGTTVARFLQRKYRHAKERFSLASAA
jgi:hypothetical protein